MGVVKVEAGVSGEPLGTFEFTIRGEEPTDEEWQLIDGFLGEAAREQRSNFPRGTSRFAERVETARVSAQERLRAVAGRRRNLELGRTAAEMVGGTAGSIAGIPGGVPGVITGGAAGSAAGSVGFDSAVEALRASGYISEEGTDPGTAGEIARRGRDAAVLDALFGAAFTFAKPGARATGRAAVGVGARARAARVSAERLGIPLGIQEVSDRVAMRKFQHILGLFPFLAQPFKESGVRRAVAVTEARRNLISEIAPVANMTRLGSELDTGLRLTTKSMRRVLSEGYEALLEDAQQRGLRITPTNFKREINRIISATTADRPQVFGETLRGTRGRPLLDQFGRPIVQIGPHEVKSPIADRVTPFLKKLQNLREMTPRQYQKLSQDLNEMMAKSKSRHEFMRAFQAKQALELDFSEIPDTMFRREYQRLNQEFHEMMQLLSGPTARRIRQVDASLLGDLNRGGRKKAVTNLYKAAFNFGSIDDIDDIYKLLERDPQAFRKGLAFYLDDVFERATQQDKVASGAKRFLGHFTGSVGDVDVVRFDFGQIRKELGLNDLGSDRAQALLHALDLSGNVDQLGKINEFLAVAELATAQGIPDVRQFVARRVTLGGMKGGVRALGGGVLAGAATPASVPQALAVVLAGRRFGRFLTDPAALAAATESLSPTASTAARRAATARFMRMLPRLLASEDEPAVTGEDVLRELQSQKLSGQLQQRGGVQLNPRELLLLRASEKR